ncbi:TrgA family protein [Pseudorhodobacter ferrugineus]|uniref:TrgA family protein n=1 Tax=Pseudorhodobacter ferrugineus TaxID=77008 RepID=UPI0003B62827|nr:TrgA family protein [Pseudorhodobacter ferrugineus]
MPTMSKLVAGVFFGALAYFTAVAFHVAMPEGTQFGQFDLIAAAIGLICGWRVMGRAVGKGYKAAAGSGVKTSISFTAWVLLVTSVVLMIRKAFRQRYDSPLEAIVDVFALAMENFLRIVYPPVPEVLVYLFAGGVLGGLLTEWVKKQWD